MAEFNDYFFYTKLCVCKKDLKNFKIFLLSYNESGVYILSNEEKKHFSFTSTFCNSLNQLNFDTICNEQTVRFLKRKAIDRQIEEKVNEMLQIKLMKLKIQKF